jgi:hypothetical protein
MSYTDYYKDIIVKMSHHIHTLGQNMTDAASEVQAELKSEGKTGITQAEIREAWRLNERRLTRAPFEHS